MTVFVMLPIEKLVQKQIKVLWIIKIVTVVLRSLRMIYSAA